MKMLLTILGCLTLLGVSTGNPSPARYDDFKVYRLFISDRHQLEDLKQLAKDFEFRHLNEVKGPGHSCDILIDPAQQRKLEIKLRDLEFEFQCTIENFQSLLEEEQGHSNKPSEDVQHKFSSSQDSSDAPVPEMNWSNFWGLPTIYNWMDTVAEKYPNLITQYVIGETYEKRPIRAMKISSKPGNKAVVMESNTHAIEWISSAANTCWAQTLLDQADEELKYLVEKYDWILVPIVNPDGFEYSHNVERLWRKNRRPTGFSNSSGICYGTDLNRNYCYEWGVNAYNSDVPCDHWYAGMECGTEPEVQAMKSFVKSHSDSVRVYLALHCFGNMVLLPYGHTDKKFPRNYDKMMRIGGAFATSAEEVFGTQFRFGASSVVNYNVSGSAKDWAYGELNIPFTSTIELRDTGKYGFILPPDQILDVCKEFSAGIKGLIRQAEKEGIFD